MLYFAYGSNMSRAVMAKFAPGAVPVGAAVLHGHRFVISGDGYASVAQQQGERVHGVLWRLSPRDRATLDAWEGVAQGLYRVATLPVHCAGQSRHALVYIAANSRIGRPKPGYMDVVLEAAREWRLPPSYVASLRQWCPRPASGASAQKVWRF